MANTTNFGWETPDDTDLVKDGAAAMRTLGNSIDSSFVDLKGGTTGQILSKNSNTDLDYIWINNDQGDITAVTAGTGISGGGTSGAVTITNSMATEITASGDIIVGTGSGTFDNLPIGTTGQVLTADTTVSPYKVKWATPSSGISILGQKTITAGTNYTTTSTTQTAVNTTNFRVSITTGSSTTIVVILKGAAQIGGGGVTSWSVSLGAGTTYEMVACNSNYIGVNEACTVHIVTGLTANTAYNVDWTYRTSTASQAAQIIGDSSNQYPRMVVLG